MPTARSPKPSFASRLVGGLRRLGWPTVVLAVFLGVNDPLVRGRAVAIWDAGNQAFPYFVLVADHARAGQLVRWDPWTDAGQPLDGEPQAGAYSPIVIAVGLVGGGRSSTFIAYWLLSWALGAVGVLGLGRHSGRHAGARVPSRSASCSVACIPETPSTRRGSSPSPSCRSCSGGWTSPWSGSRSEPPRRRRAMGPRRARRSSVDHHSRWLLRGALDARARPVRIDDAQRCPA